MSFSSETKNRLCAAQGGCAKCERALLAGILDFGGDLRPDGLRLITENETAADRIRKGFEQYFHLPVTFEQGKSGRFFIEYPSLPQELLLMCDKNRGFARRRLLPFDCCRAAYVRGAFLGGGSVSDPSKGYHLEFDTKTEDASVFLKDTLEECGIPSKITSRKGHYIVYIKEAQLIADALGTMGDSSGAMTVYNIQIEKEMRNAVNRQVNCETANVVKTTRAASRQIAAIHKIMNESDLTHLPDSLQEIARLRLLYPEESLKDLGELLNPPLGKSGVNHRLERLCKIAEEL